MISPLKLWNRTRKTSANKSELKLFERYCSWNRKQAATLHFELTSRGFFSEINNLLNAMVYALIHDMRLSIDSSKFQYAAKDKKPVALEDLFAVPLAEVFKPSLWNRLGSFDLHARGVGCQDFQHIRNSIMNHHTDGLRITTDLFGPDRSIFELKSLLARSMLVRKLDSTGRFFLHGANPCAGYSGMD